jgi:hypothetical protein
MIVDIIRINTTLFSKKDTYCLHIRILQVYDGFLGKFSVRGEAYMAKTKAAKQSEAPAGESQVEERLTNKAEAIRRALAKLGNKALPAEIQDFIKTHYAVEMTTKVISVYKSKLAKKKGKPGRKPKEAGAVGEAAPKPVAHGDVTFKDMRTVKEISDRLGPARMRELVALVAD